MFSHLHVHTEFSLLDGMCRIPQLVEKARDLGMESLAITDHGSLYGIIEFYLQAREAGIKPILGCEVYVATGDRHSRTPADKNPYHLVLLVANERGYHNLIQLTTRAHLEGFYYRPRTDRELLAEFSEGLIPLSACPNGEMGRLILEGRVEEAEKAARWYRDVFGEFYLELMRHDIPEQEQINKALVSLSQSGGFPLVATNDVHYVEQADAYAQDVLLCIQTNSTVHDERRPRMAGDFFYLKSPQEMAALFADLPQAIANTQLVAERCQLDLEFDRIYLPEVELPPGQTADEQLAELCYQALPQRYPHLSTEVEQRLKYELDVIRHTNFANYFLVVWDVISFARSQAILFGVRGSAAASIVLYVLGVTDIDPLTHRLVFERFLNVERKELPDIDLDFQDDRRDEVISYVAEKYGADHVAQIITFGTLGARAALRDVGRALGLDYGQVDRVARQVPPLINTIEKALEASAELRRSYQEDEIIRQLIDTAAKVEGVARHASTHAAGVVISKEPLTNHLPLQRPTRGEEGIAMTQFAMDDIARIGLLKMDFLGLANLTILGKAKEAIHQTRGIEIDLHHIPFDDARTFELLASGETMGVFQLEGAGMRRYIKELKPGSFSDIAAMVGLYRPGPKQFVPTFIEAKHGRAPIRYPHPALADILKETYGVIVYQDQVLHIVQTFAGYSLGEADVVRKAMGKKVAETMRKEKKRFVAGAREKGFDKELAEEIWQLIEPFAGYAFNKAHSVSYALIAYQTAYLKANYPVEFMLAVLTVNADHPERVGAAVAECYRLGIKVLPPDVNHSRETFTVEQDSRGEPAIRFGLAAIKNVGAAAVAPIIAARNEGEPFESIEDFCRRADLRGMNKRTLESLVKAGALDSLGERGALLGGLDRLLSLAQREQRLKETGQSTMFDLWGRSVAVPLPELELPRVEIGWQEKLDWEKELLGVYLSDHPLRAAARKLADKVTVLCGQIDADMVGQQVIIAGVVTSVRLLFTRDRRPFASAVVEDIEGSIEVTAWPEVYERNRELWEEGNILLLEGKVKAREERVQLVCEYVTRYKVGEEEPAAEAEVEQPPPTRRRIHLGLASTSDSDADLARLRELFAALGDFPGEDEVYLTIASDGKATRLELPQRTARYCPELHQRLVALVGEGEVRVEEGT